MDSIKTKIKTLATEQVFLKNQRKTIKLQGERKLQPWQATAQHKYNRIELRELYMAYGIIRGKKPEDIERNPKVPLDMEKINKIVEQYVEVVYHNQK